MQSTGPSSNAGAAARAPLGTTPRLQQLKATPHRAGQAASFYFDVNFQTEAVKVLPGEYFVTDEDLLITTTLGSCIAACLWDRDRRIGGMNHFMLPDGPDGSGADGGRYGGFAMDQLIGELVKRGANRSTMEAKVFGGGAVIDGMTSINVGERNAAFVFDYLRTERIAVLSKDVLDIYPRKVCYLPASGKAMVKRLAAANHDALLAQDRLARQRATAPSAVGGSVDLF